MAFPLAWCAHCFHATLPHLCIFFLDALCVVPPGERIIHKITRRASEADTLQLYRDKITKLLSQGASAGRTYKPCMSAA